MDINLKSFSQDELCEIYHNVNEWRWDDRLGDKPEGFDSLPDFNWRLRHKIARRKTKEEIIGPVFREIKKLVPEKELLRHHHIVNLGRTNEEFEKWWENEEDRINTQIQRRNKSVVAVWIFTAALIATGYMLQLLLL